MNWEAVGAVAELVGAIGVIASLVYLAKQIQASSENVSQNTQALISNRDISSMEFALANYGPQIENAELAALMLKGHSNPEDLSELERYRFNFVMAASFESHQTMFLQHGRSSVSPELWDYYSRQFDGFCRSPGVVHWWKHSRSRFDPAFAQYIDKKITLNLPG
jgi:hypothetical protein